MLLDGKKSSTCIGYSTHHWTRGHCRPTQNSVNQAKNLWPCRLYCRGRYWKLNRTRFDDDVSNLTVRLETLIETITSTSRASTDEVLDPIPVALLSKSLMTCWDWIMSVCPQKNAIRQFELRSEEGTSCQFSRTPIPRVWLCYARISRTRTCWSCCFYTWSREAYFLPSSTDSSRVRCFPQRHLVSRTNSTLQADWCLAPLSAFLSKMYRAVELTKPVVWRSDPKDPLVDYRMTCQRRSTIPLSTQKLLKLYTSPSMLTTVWLVQRMPNLLWLFNDNLLNCSLVATSLVATSSWGTQTTTPKTPEKMTTTRRL